MIEDLNLKGLARILSEVISMTAIGKLQQLLEYKAGYAGKQVLKVDPRYTTQDCSSCGYREEVSSVRHGHVLSARRRMIGTSMQR
ncbi:MAG: zinc ribbon domain-containing protein [Deinococcales bacterium]